VESVLCSCITVWHGSCSAAEKKALQREVKAAQRTVGHSLSTTTDIYTSGCTSCIMKDPTHPLLVPLPSGRRLRSIKSRTMLHNSEHYHLKRSFLIKLIVRDGSGEPETSHS